MISPVISLSPISTNMVLKDRVYEALKSAITSMDVYGDEEAPRLEERRLAEELGVSRTPVREAITRLEQDGLVRTVPRRGAYVVRKTKKQIMEMICVWAALESMAARIATQRAKDQDIARLRELYVTFTDSNQARANIDEYSETNIEFHQKLMSLAGCDLLNEMAAGLFIHMRSIRMRTIKEHGRAEQSVVDHLSIIEALEIRDAGLAERLVREHTLRLAEHIKKNVDYLV